MEPRVSIITLCVEDLVRAHAFYTEGLGFRATRGPESGIVFLELRGLCLALYPQAKMGEELPGESTERGAFPGFTLAHNTREKHEVDALLERAVAAGARLVKPAQDTFWGGYSGYFADPDGFLWEIAWAESWEFQEDGSLVLD